MNIFLALGFVFSVVVFMFSIVIFFTIKNFQTQPIIQEYVPLSDQELLCSHMNKDNPWDFHP